MRPSYGYYEYQYHDAAQNASNQSQNLVYGSQVDSTAISQALPAPSTLQPAPHYGQENQTYTSNNVSNDRTPSVFPGSNIGHENNYETITSANDSNGSRSAITSTGYSGYQARDYSTARASDQRLNRPAISRTTSPATVKQAAQYPGYANSYSAVARETQYLPNPAEIPTTRQTQQSAANTSTYPNNESSYNSGDSHQVQHVQARQTQNSYSTSYSQSPQYPAVVAPSRPRSTTSTGVSRQSPSDILLAAQQTSGYPSATGVQVNTQPQQNTQNTHTTISSQTSSRYATTAQSGQYQTDFSAPRYSTTPQSAPAQQQQPPQQGYLDTMQHQHLSHSAATQSKALPQQHRSTSSQSQVSPQVRSATRAQEAYSQPQNAPLFTPATQSRNSPQITTQSRSDKPQVQGLPQVAPTTQNLQNRPHQNTQSKAPDSRPSQSITGTKKQPQKSKTTTTSKSPANSSKKLVPGPTPGPLQSPPIEPAQRPNDKPKPKRKSRAKAATTATATSEPSNQTSEHKTSQDEDEIRALMAKMRELNARNPNLLANMWQEETQKEKAPTPIAGKSTARPKNTLPSPVMIPAERSQAQSDGSESHARPSSSSAPTNPRRTLTVVEKKNQLALVATEYLKSLPENTKKMISHQEIQSIINVNPTYVELCEQLEKKGIVLERYAFARVLRTAVDGPADADHALNNSGQERSGTIPSGSAPSTSTMSTSTTVPTQVDTPSISNIAGASSQPQPQVRQFINGSWQDTAGNPSSSIPQKHHQVSAPLSHVQSVAFLTAPSSMRATPNNGIMHTGPPKPIFQNKAGAARKRNFMDLVDLSALSDDEDELRPPIKKQALETKSIPEKLNTNDAVPKTEKIPEKATPASLSQAISPNPPADTHVQPIGQANALPSHVQHGPPRFDHTHNQFAQPHGPPPSQHWNVGPPRPLPPVHPTIAHRQFASDEVIRRGDVVKPLKKSQALRRSKYNVKTIARDVLLATGKHPEMRSLNAHIDILKNQFVMVDVSSDLSSFRWDLVDPGGFQPPLKRWNNSEDELDVEEEYDDSFGTETIAQATVQSATTESPMEAALPQNVLPGPKRRGRPPKKRLPTSVSGSPSVLQPASQPSLEGIPNLTSDVITRSSETPQQAAMKTTPSTRARISQATAGSPSPSVAGSAGSGALTYKALREAAIASGQTAPRRGRPVGWRKHMQQSAPGSTGKAAKQAQSSSHTAGPGVQADRKPNLNFQVYRCEWKACNTELHNLDTLRKHVFKIHRSEAALAHWYCAWKDCSPRAELKYERPWQEHLNSQHFTPLAWEKGDGPKAGVSVDNGSSSDAYLSDSWGRRVTPTVQTTMYPSTEEAGPSASQPGRPRKNVEQEARDALEARKRWVRQVGVGMDRGGCKLVTEKRRMGFLDDEDFEEIVEDEDELGM